MTDQTTTATPAVRGRPFPKGNGGRRPGSKNQNTLILEAVSDGDKEELVRKGIELAKAGDVVMLKFFLSRILARERAITLDLPKMESADDAVEALAAIISAVCEGKITPSEAANLAGLVNSYARAIELGMAQRWRIIPRGAVAHATVLGFLLHYGEPRIQAPIRDSPTCRASNL
jgi:hypothetical protein